MANIDFYLEYELGGQALSPLNALTYGEETQIEAPKIPSYFTVKSSKTLMKALNSSKTPYKSKPKHSAIRNKRYTCVENPLKFKAFSNNAEEKQVSVTPEEEIKSLKPLDIQKKSTLLKNKENPELLEYLMPDTPAIPSKYLMRTQKK